MDTSSGTNQRIAVTGATGRLGHHVVEVLAERGHEHVGFSRKSGVDVVTGDGLAAALEGVQVVIDAAGEPTGDPATARAWFPASARNLHQVGQQAGVERIVAVSIVGCDRFPDGYVGAKFVHEQALNEGPLPVQIVRATQFHEFVAMLLEWGTQGDVATVARMRTQLVAARAVAEVLVDVATGVRTFTTPYLEVAGPREETLVGAARLLAARRGHPLTVEEAADPADPLQALYDEGALLPGPGAVLAGPTYADWLAATA